MKITKGRVMMILGGFSGIGFMSFEGGLKRYIATIIPIVVAVIIEEVWK
jgi:hypothetical protein